MRAAALAAGSGRTSALMKGAFGAPAATLILLAAVVACSPAADFDRRAKMLRLDRFTVAGSGFEHVGYRKNRSKAGILHVYLDGDGTPSIAGWPTQDPTPRRSLVLDLMVQDPAASVYLGRPCYHGLDSDVSCSRAYWTSARYSETVVASLENATRRILDEGSFDGVVWIGYSGGGTLAVLLALRFPETRAVVTIAANLDIDAWADLHGYERLVDSLNPATIAELPEDVLVRHYVGERDRVVPPALTMAGVRGAGDEVVVSKGFDHVCCWAKRWPDILAHLAEDLPSASSLR